MKLSNAKTRVILALIILVSLGVSVFFLSVKQGYHEDELLTYNLANSSKQLSIGGWNTPEDMNEYLAVTPEHRFDYAQVVRNQIIDASHPPFYYALVHTVCSFFPNVFSKWLAFAINVAMMTGALLMLFKIGKRVTGSNLYALIAAGGYALSIACITTTVYLRMYASLTFFVLTFINLTLWFYEKKKDVRLTHCLVLLPVVTLGILTQYYFILCAGLTGLVYLIFSIKEKNIRSLLLYIATAVAGAGLALAIYPHIIQNVLGGNRGFGSLNFSVDAVTIVTYIFYKLGTYVQILAKDLFLNQIWLFCVCAAAALGFGVYFRFFKKKKLSRKACFVVVPGLVFFLGISLVSPFNSDRYVMASLPLIAMMFAFAFIKIVKLLKNEKLTLAVPAAMLLACVLGLLTVTPYYIYGKTNLYEPKTKDALFVGTAMLEWNKCIDKFMLYDNTMIVQTSEMSHTLAEELESFANARGVITNGKITAFADAYMNNGDVDREEGNSIQNLASDARIQGEEELTVYISRLADSETVIRTITQTTALKNCELIQADYSFDEFYNWYDYFVETESYCNVYRFYR